MFVFNKNIFRFGTLLTSCIAAYYPPCRGIYHFARRTFLFPVDGRYFLMLSPVMSSLFPPAYVGGRQDFAWSLETDNNQKVTNFRDLITVSVGSLVIVHVNLFSVAVSFASCFSEQLWHIKRNGPLVKFRCTWMRFGRTTRRMVLARAEIWLTPRAANTMCALFSAPSADKCLLLVVLVSS